MAAAKVLVGFAAWLAAMSTDTVGTRLPAWGGNLWTSAAFAFTFGATGGTLIAGSARGPQTRWLGLHFLLIATTFAAVLGRNGAPFGLSDLFDRLRLEAALPATLWAFVSVFPARAHASHDAEGDPPSIDVWLLAPIACASVLLDQVDSEFLNVSYWPLLMLTMVPAAPLLIRRAAQVTPGERRRVLLFVAALTVGMLPIALDIVLRTVSPGWRAFIATPLNNRIVTTFVIAALLSVPLTTTYSVVVARVFDFRLVLRTAIRYALARTSLLLLVFVPLAVLLRILYVNRALTLQDLLTGPSALSSLLVAAAAFAALSSRTLLMKTIDRYFFRDEYDAQEVLTQLVTACREAESPEQLASVLITAVDRALRPSYSAVLVFDSVTKHLMPLESGIPPLPTDSMLARLLAASDLPLDVDLRDHGSVMGRLDGPSREWLREGEAQLLVPMRALDGTVAALVVLGPKKSELSYSMMDRQLLAAVGAAGGLTLGKLFDAKGTAPAVAVQTNAQPDLEAPARECPECGLVMASRAIFCGCGGLLEEADVPKSLAAKYEITQRIGRGGMGVVYKAIDVALVRQVAVKTLPRSEPAHFKRLRREAQAMARLSHPALAGIYGLETWNDRPFLIVEFLAGGTLAARLSNGPLSIPDTLRMLTAITQGVAALHHEGLLHRDIKPTNIAFSSSGHPKLLDFGLTKPGSTIEDDVTFKTETGHLLGTASYMPPEAFDGEPPTAAFDLWALAVVLIECVAGQNPFRGSNIIETYARIAQGMTATVGVLAGEYPGLGDFVARALSGDPRQRPASAEIFLDELRRLEAR